MERIKYRPTTLTYWVKLKHSVALNSGFAKKDKVYRVLDYVEADGQEFHGVIIHIASEEKFDGKRGVVGLYASEFSWCSEDGKPTQYEEIK